MIALRSVLPFAALLAVTPACGSATPAPTSPGEAGEHHEEHGEHHEEHGEHHGHEGHHGDAPGPVHDFHEALAPIWHMDKGPDRAAKACAQATALHDKAAAIVSAPAPEAAHADEAGWKTDADALVAATKALAAECEKEGRPQLEERFSALHDGFHKLAERVEKKRP